jgi:hypothetical protein
MPSSSGAARVATVAWAAVFLALPAGTARAQSPTVSTRMSPAALAELLRTASASNRLPDSLVSYKAQVETEVGVILKQEDGIETVASLEQVASTLRWTRAGTYDQHVIGYRSEQLGLSFSMLSVLREGWINPVLYGNRLRSRANPSDRTDDPLLADRLQNRQRMQRPDSVVVVHPLAADRDSFYVYTQGDTLVTLQSGARRIPIVRVHVEPRADIADSVAIFVGDMELDASRGTLVKLRGYFARAGKARHHGISLTIGDAVAFVEFENAEYDGRFWLPAQQRIELQTSLPVLGDNRAIIRIASRFPGIVVNDTVIAASVLARSDSLRARVLRRLTYATNDSVSGYSHWRFGLGGITAGMHADDFNDIAPDRMRTTGAPRLDIAAPHLSDVVHFDRIEGWYTGLGVKLALRDRAPGVVLRANGGYAWSEHTTRGRVSAERTLGATTLTLRAGRSLDNTNDFQTPLDSAPSIASLGTDDAFDYVDRRSATVGVTQYLGGRHLARLRLDYGAVDDRYVATHVTLGLSRRSRFLPNRGVDAGGYRRLIAALEWRPDFDAEAVRPGRSARLLYERGDGTVSYERIEARATSRQPIGPFTWVIRGDVGGLFGRTFPAQQLFELGKGQYLPGYATKEFAGTRAAVVRSNLIYTSPFFREPLRVTRRWWLPAFAPGASVGFQSGWTDAPSEAGRAAILRLGMLPDSAGVLHPVSRVSDGVRTTAAVGLRFFAGSFFVGFARPVDHAGPWKFLFTGGRAL